MRWSWEAECSLSQKQIPETARVKRRFPNLAVAVSHPCRPEAGKQWQHLLKTNKRINATILRFNAIYTLRATHPLPDHINTILAHSRQPSARFGIFDRVRRHDSWKLERVRQGFSGSTCTQPAPCRNSLPTTPRYQPDCKTTPQKPGLKQQPHAIPNLQNLHLRNAGLTRATGKRFWLVQNGGIFGGISTQH